MVKVSLPFDNDQLFELLQGDKLKEQYLVNCKASMEALPDSLLYYISNIGLNVEYDLTGCSYEQRLNLFKQYLNINCMYNHPIFVRTFAQVMLHCKNLDIELDDYCLFSFQELDDVCKTIDTLPVIASFLDSIPLYFSYQLKGLNPEFNKEEFEAVDTRAIPVNVALLFSLPGFTSYWSYVLDCKWYTRQFETAYFNNKLLSDYLFSKDCLIFGCALRQLSEG